MKTMNAENMTSKNFNEDYKLAENILKGTNPNASFEEITELVTYGNIVVEIMKKRFGNDQDAALNFLGEQAAKALLSDKDVNFRIYVFAGKKMC